MDRTEFIRTIQASSGKIRREFYDNAMAKFDEIEWIRVIKPVYLRQKEKNFMIYELDYMHKAKNYLHGEISVLLQIPMNQVEGHIAFSVSKDAW